MKYPGLGRRITRRRRLLARRTAFALADFFQQFDLNLLDFEEPVVLPSQKMIDFLVQVPSLELGLEIDLMIIFRSQSIACLGPVLAHHDDGRLTRGQAGEDEVQENKGIGIKRPRGKKDSVNYDPDNEDTAKSDDKPPTAAELRDFIRQMLTKGQFALELFFNVLGKHFMLPQTFDDFVIECC